MNTNLILPSIVEWHQENGIQGMYDHIERCGHICYRSNTKGGNSAAIFADAMCKSGHGAMLEHGSVYLIIDAEKYRGNEKVQQLIRNKYSKSFIISDENSSTIYVTTNYRVIVENGFEEIMNECWSDPTMLHKKRRTFVFDTNIGISREFNRHRVNSMAESSTRYCNYTKEKMGNAITAIIPMWLRERIGVLKMKAKNDSFMTFIGDIINGHVDSWEPMDFWLFSVETSDFCYRNLIRLGCKPQEAREVLTLATNTQLAHTAFEDDWQHFIGLRAKDSPTNHPHPMAMELAKVVEKCINNE